MKKQLALFSSSMRIILISDCLTADIVDLAMLQGAYACLSKPGDIEQLIHALSEALSEMGDPESVNDK